MSPAGVQVETATLHGIPLYDGDREQSEGLPYSVIQLKARVVASDALLLATPEYNNGIPGVFKNAIDWLSRPPEDIPHVFGGRPVALIGASPGSFGTIRSQNDWLPVLRTLGTVHRAGSRLLVSRAHNVFGESGEMTDDPVREKLTRFMQQYAQFVKTHRVNEAAPS